MSAITARPLRADARRNRRRVLDAARDAFATDGLDAQIDDVAARAGVGVGTVYRHFPTKEALVEALVVERFDHLLEAVRAALDRSGDPWDAFSDFMWAAAQIQADDRALAEITAKRPLVMRELCPGSGELQSAVAELVERAQATGQLRSDFAPDDVPILMCGLGRITQGGCGAEPAWERYLRYTLDGLRTTSSSTTSASRGSSFSAASRSAGDSAS